MVRKILYTLLIVQATSSVSYSQGFLKGLAEKASRAGQDLIIKKGTKKVEKVIDGPAAQAKPHTNETAKAEAAPMTTTTAEIKSNSKFDFIPGEKILLFDNFAQDVIGEFPLKWFTSGSAEVVKLEGLPGNWLQMNNGSMLSPILKFPENFTVEFDLFLNLNVNSSKVFPGFHFEIFDGGDKAKRLDAYNYKLNNILYFSNTFNRDKAVFTLDSRENARQKLVSDKIFLAGFQNKYKSVVHVAITVQKERLRLWYDDTKVIDLPTAVANPANFNQMLFTGGKTKEGYPAFYITNLKIASGTPDMRSKLLETGRYVTNGILFDSGSDKIKPESYGLLKEIAGILNAESGLKIKIVGHTDNDGKADLNMDLSRKRAEAIKKALVNTYQVDSDKLVTDGKGASEPVSSNSTSEGKAENRRVEFIKM
ncbi:OmpA family protein [Sphingobacterium siyangense]|uniref:OmpA family protein n=1 Tax=Sphingobacterium siyangense TaxID=459529 RepID=UPI003DA49F70